MKRRHGSIFWSLILISIGLLFLLNNLHLDIRPWQIIAKYWPLLIIFWGLSKLAGYFSSDEDPAAGQRSLLTGGDVVLLLFLLILGSVVTKAVTRDFWPGAHFGIDTGEFDSDSWDAGGESHAFIEERSQPVSKKVKSLELSNLYGSVEVNTHNAEEIRVKLEKRVKSKDENKAKETADLVKLRIEPKGTGYIISTNREELDELKKEGLKTNLSVWVPKSMALTLSNMYGPITVDKVAGNHKLTNGYGDVTMREVDGSVRVENKYGAVNLSGISGDCDIESKEGTIDLTDIGGKTQIDHGYGSVVLKKMKGAVILAHRYGKLECNELDSTLTVNGRYVEVEGNNIKGDVQINTSYRNVDLENVAGSIQIQGKHGDVNISSDQAPNKAIVVDGEYSGVTINLPGESRFVFDGYSKFGKMISGFETIAGGTSTNFAEGTHIHGKKGEGGPSIKVNTSFRDIHLNAT